MKKAVSVTSNLIATSVAAVLSASLIMSGTWAWQSFDQEAVNKSSASIGAGGRIHTNFNGETKHVFVENYKESEDVVDPYVDINGNDIYVRVRMEEYLEIGEMAGEKDSSLRDGNITVLGNPLADINDADTWDVVYMDDSGLVSGFEAAREYVSLILGGKDVYMPTFNRNDDSREGIINGTLAGNDGIDRTLEDAYSDYVKYALNAADGVTSVTAMATYDMDDNDTEEKTPILHPLDNANIYQREETHYAQATLESTKIINMEDWMIMFEAYDEYAEKIKYDPELEFTLVEPENPKGPYWVFDTDGWVYWAEPLEPQTATGLLLKETISHKKYEGEWYYEISTRAQYATRGDWGSVREATGFYDEGVTADALVLLQTISGTVIREIDSDVE